MWDLRIPSGWFFVLVGIILSAVGIFSPGNRAALTQINVNLYVGMCLGLFGGVLLVLARKR